MKSQTRKSWQEGNVWAHRWAGCWCCCQHEAHPDMYHQQGCGTRDPVRQPSSSACCQGGSPLDPALMRGQDSLERGQNKAARRIRGLRGLTHKEGWKEIALCHQEEKTIGRCAGSFTNKRTQMQKAKAVQQLDSTTRKGDLLQSPQSHQRDQQVNPHYEFTFVLFRAEQLHPSPHNADLWCVGGKAARRHFSNTFPNWNRILKTLWKDLETKHLWGVTATSLYIKGFPTPLLLWSH